MLLRISNLYRVIPKHMIVVLLLGTAMSAVAEINEELSQRFYNHLGVMLTQKVGEPLMSLYRVDDVDGDGLDDVVLTDYDKVHFVVYPGADPASPSRGYRETEPERCLYMPVHYLLQNLKLPNDITLRERPLFAGNVNKKRNRFTAFTDDLYSTPLPMSAYKHLVFKPHVNDVRCVDAAKGVFSLSDATKLQRMFRGYASGEVAPILVTDGFLATHEPLQYSRWKSPEREVHIEGNPLRAVKEFFHAQRALDTRWLAQVKCDDGTTIDFSEVLLVADNRPLAVVVGLKNDQVVAWLAVEGCDAGGGNFIWYGADMSDYWEHIHEIMAIMATDQGLELYVRYNSMEGTHYVVYRVVGNALVTMQDDYDYWEMN